MLLVLDHYLPAKDVWPPFIFTEYLYTLWNTAILTVAINFLFS
jgi:hypothetical protein